MSDKLVEAVAEFLARDPKKPAFSNLEEQAHKVSVTVSDPNHPMITKRNERMEKRVIVNAENRDQAVVKAKQHYSKKGMKVHSAEYHSAQPASSMK